MYTEFDVVKGRGLAGSPDNTKPASSEATAAGQRYREAAKQFDELLAKIRSYQGFATSVPVASGVYELIMTAARLAVEVRNRAQELTAFPGTLMRVDLQYYSFQHIADAAAEAYYSRMRELEEAEARVASRPYPSNFIIRLALHDGFKDGHPLSKHVRLTMNDFKRRHKEEGLPTVSSFTDQATAEEVISRAIILNWHLIDQAADGARVPVPISEIRNVGYVVHYDTPSPLPRFVRSGLIITFKDSTHPSGFRIHTVVLDDERRQ